MIKYAKIIDNDLGLCEVGLGTNVEFYRSIGMVELDVEISEKDNRWYLTDKCPHKSEEEKQEQEKQRRNSEIDSKISELQQMALPELLNGNKSNVDLYLDVINGLEQARPI